jgi:hypothetical protein
VSWRGILAAMFGRTARDLAWRFWIRIAPTTPALAAARPAGEKFVARAAS